MAADALRALAPYSATPQINGASWPEPVRTGRRSHTATQAIDAEAPTALGILSCSDASLAVASSTTELGDPQELIGRGVEVERLEALARGVEEGDARVVLLTGVTGVGKSYLASSMATRFAAAGRFTLLRGAYHESGGGLIGLRAAVDAFLGTVGQGPERVARAASELMRRCGEDDTREVEALVKFLRGAAGERNVVFALVTRFLRRLSQRRPVLLLLDDLHFGGADAAAFLNHILSEQALDPLACLILGAVTSDHTDADFGHALARSNRFEGTLRHTLSLGPLALDELARVLAIRHGIRPEHGRRSAERASGNPLFALHLATVDDPAHGSDATETPRVADTELPPALGEIVAASLERRLKSRGERVPELRRVLQRSAVLGDRVNVELLTSLLEDTNPDALDESLDELLDLGVFVETRNPNELAFEHGLLRDVLLASIGRRTLRRLHRRAAALRMEREAPDPGPIGDHLHAAGDVEQAVAWWCRAVDHDISRGETARASRHALLAMAAMPPSPTRVEMRFQAGRLLNRIGHFDRAIETLDPLLVGDDIDALLRAAEIVAHCQNEKGDIEGWNRTLEAARSRYETITRDTVSPSALRAYHRAWAFRLNHTGEFAAAREHAIAALTGRDQSPHEFVQTAARFALGTLHSRDASEGLTIAQEAVERTRPGTLDHAYALRVQALMFTGTGEREPAVARARASLEMFRSLGVPRYVPMVTMDLAICLANNRQVDNVIEMLSSALDMSARLGLRGEVGRAIATLAIARSLLDPSEQVLQTLGALVNDSVQRGGAPGFLWTVEISYVALLVKYGRIDEALAAWASHQPFRAVPVLCLLLAHFGLIARGFKSAGHHAAAVDVAEQTVALCERCPDPIARTDAHGLRDEITGHS